MALRVYESEDRNQTAVCQAAGYDGFNISHCVFCDGFLSWNEAQGGGPPGISWSGPWCVLSNCTDGYYVTSAGCSPCTARETGAVVAVLLAIVLALLGLSIGFHVHFAMCMSQA